MQASAWRGGSSARPVYGIRVGRPNRDAYFDRAWSSIEVEMDGRWQTFQLTPGFWNQCTEFRDRGSPRIREWLERHFTTDWPKGSPPRFRLEVLGGGRFRLSPHE
ncbi:hypothetical protein [Halomonas halodenitrificans]|uniref:hypothetical protein n=1 Tax=Halomonas halodenitrificans TaxID=28252 RepID=UPI000482F5AC|nr:hypothetical protein [Halomonas halodenitrificans]